MEKLFKAIQLICHTLRTDRQTHLMYKEDTSHTRRTHLMYKEDTSRTRRTHLIQGGHISYKGDTSHTRGTHLIQGGRISYKGDASHTRGTHLIQGGRISYKEDASHTRGTHLIQGGHISCTRRKTMELELHYVMVLAAIPLQQALHVAVCGHLSNNTPLPQTRKVTKGLIQLHPPA